MDTKPIGPGQTDLQRTLDTKNREINIPSDNDTKSSQRIGKNFDVSLSPEAQQLMKAQEKALDIARSTSPIREDRVADIKARIANGTYQIEPGKIADGMMMEAIKDSLASKSEV
ncbi:MAG: flagellar biosynthesis anti-sigma factor FlgM [Pseudobacteriovorax sp.]|nr:flagellar biosynthesis anti-sigma factor FlgM [Pseudobacteriovorax sp.]